MSKLADTEWWRGAVIYQVYPRSLMDTNGDGVGDLKGICQKLDYIAELGVDAIWVSPFFKSPMDDFGYDISDYRDVDPLFGDMDDFDALIEGAHARGLKIIIDQVLSHTSNQHAWFLDSRENTSNDKADWYVWADARDDGTPPNNWMSIFGGVAWEWEPRRQQYYLHNFLRTQPDLNFHNPNVRRHVLDNVEFWLKKGVDGLRLDAINFCFHDQQLRDNPAKPKDKRQGRGFSEDNPYAWQYHYYNNTRPENIEFIKELRALLDRYPGVVSLGEISSENSLQSMAEYTSGNDRLHMAYSFELLTDDGSSAFIRRTVEELEQEMDGGWPCWAVGNHDVTRVISRWGDNIDNPAQAKMINAMVMSLKGSVCSYQGEELGLPDSPVPFEALQDPYGITFWPTFKGRDGCRTPIPWRADAPEGGFSDTKPWLPVCDTQLPLAVDRQQADQSSVLNAYKTFIHWRKTQPALITGDIEFITLHDDLLAFKRTGSEDLLVIFNLSSSQVSIPLSLLKEKQLMIKPERVKTDHGLSSAVVTDSSCEFKAYQVLFASV